MKGGFTTSQVQTAMETTDWSVLSNVYAPTRSSRDAVLYCIERQGYPDEKNTWEPKEFLLPYVEWLVDLVTDS